MTLAVVGLGYVGLVAAVCLAAAGHRVIGIEADPRRVDLLRSGHAPFWEPGVDDLLRQGLASGNLTFTRDFSDLVEAEVVLLAVGTPSGLDAAVDTRDLEAAIADLAPHLGPDAVVVLKSTVPVGTQARVVAALGHPTASNPEFLREGSAISDFRSPDRVILGVTDPRAESALRRMYAPFVASDRILVMDPASAELTKYAANTLLAARLSFLNELADLCGPTGADIHEVARGLAADHRIGPAFLAPSLGWGGSCLPKDVAALQALGQKHGVPLAIPAAAVASNTRHGERWIEAVHAALAPVRGRVVAAWGLAFKANTDDVRHSPALAVVESLLAAGAVVRAHDPRAMEAARRILGDRVHWCDHPAEALTHATALVIGTEWDDYRRPPVQGDLEVVCDGRNLWRDAPKSGWTFEYLAVGNAGQPRPNRP